MGSRSRTTRSGGRWLRLALIVGSLAMPLVALVPSAQAFPSVHRSTAGDEPTPLVTLAITAGGQAKRLAVEVADTPEERAIGLMGREDLGAADGMAFLWPGPTSVGFWMKNTLIPLSIAFWDEAGTIVAMLDMEPCVADPCPVYDPGVSYWGAVEVEQGAFEQRGVGLGDTVVLVSGFSPAQGKVGTSVVITGSGFTATGLTFGSVPAAFVVDSPVQITATVPPHAGTGPIEVSTEGGIGPSAADFVVSHPRSLSLRLPETHGRLWVSDRWSACAARVRVQLQRRQGGQFVQVASRRTDPEGAYTFAPIDEPGRYRVVAKKVTLASGDVCLKATSPIVSV